MEGAAFLHLPNMSLKTQAANFPGPTEGRINLVNPLGLLKTLSCWQLVFLNKLVPAEVGWIWSDPPELVSLKAHKTAPRFICKLPPCS